ncbi:MAG: M55 family metallopeptidase [Hyphomonadaceae bacterium]|nr:M55 family metallopeptidase [Hyphomonadaceae bacterium]
MRRLFIAADIEGVAGVASVDQLGPKEFEWQAARGWMTAEVGAAATVALQAGYDEVIVADGHGNALNLLPDGLPPRTRLIRSWPRPLLQMEGVESAGVDACLMIGFHGSATGAAGVLAHTYHGGLFAELRLNGVAFSEAYLNAALAGEYGVPTVLITGDDAACAQLRDAIPAVETCVLKRAISWKSAESMTPKEGAAAVAAATSRALARRAEIAPFKLDPPFTLDMTFTNRVTAGLLDLLPCFTARDPFTARFEAGSVRDIMQAISFAIFYPRGVL